MSSLILPNNDRQLWLAPNANMTEIEQLLKTSPAVAKKFVEKCAKGEMNWDDFLPAERDIILHSCLDASLNGEGEHEAIKALRDADWVREPPSPEEFLNNPKYLGKNISESIYEPWRRDLIFVLDPKNEIFEHVLAGGIGVGKTQIAILSQLYKLCILTCLRDIPGYFGLNSSTQISFGLFSLSIDKAEGAISDIFKKIISESPYFKNVFPLKKSRTVKKVLNNQGTNSRGTETYEVILPPGLQLLIGSKVSHALSYAVVSAILDEMNFRGKRTVSSEEDQDGSQQLYDEVRSRITSRFENHGLTPGILSVISSKKTSSDFLEAHIAKINGSLSQKTGGWVAHNDPHAYISSYSQWDVKPSKYSKDRFYVFIGSSSTSSRILTDEEATFYPPDTPNLIQVPESTRRHFEADVNTALKQLAGISSSPQHLLFEDPLLLRKIWDFNRKSPFSTDEIYVGLKTKQPISSYLNIKDFFRDAGFAMVPLHHPSMIRTLHIDLSKSGDATGIAMGGCSAIIETVGQNALQNRIINALSPEIWIDFALGIRAPKGDQVDYEKIQQFINYLRSMGFRIEYITFDSWNCLSIGTFISTNRGLIPIEDIVIGDVVQSKSGPNKVVNLFNYGKRKTLKITTTDGDIIEGTENHKIEVVKSWKYTRKKANVRKIKNSSVSKKTEWLRKNSEGTFKEPIFMWEELKNINIGDILSLTKKAVSFTERKNYPLLKTKENAGYTTACKQNTLSRWTPPEQVTPELAEVLGLIWGDGHIGKTHVALTVSDKEFEDANRIYFNLFGEYFSYYKAPNNKNNCFGEIRFTSQWFINWLKLNELNKPYIPEAIFKSSRRVQSHFLRGLFAADGNVSKSGGNISLATKHKKLANQVRLLLRTEFGLESCLTEIDKSKYSNIINAEGKTNIIKSSGDGKHYVVSIRGSREQFLSGIGFSYSTKQKQLEKFIGVKGRSLYSRVMSIEESENEVFDLEVENDHSYIANGFISHNSVGPAQMLIKDGFRVGDLSTDRTDIPAMMFRDIVTSGNISIPKNKVLEREMLNLVRDTRGMKGKVDHPKMNPDGSKGSKDIADGVIGCVANVYAMLTDVKKHPYTANADLVAQTFSNMYPNQKYGDQGYQTDKQDEQQSMNDYIDIVNPLNFKIS